MCVCVEGMSGLGVFISMKRFISIDPTKDPLFFQLRDCWFKSQLCTVSVKASFCIPQLYFMHNVL